MRRTASSAAQRGFTLVEAIIVIVVVGVLAAVVAVFIRAPVQNYVDAAGRAEVSDAADLALRRMARDLRLALPNSVHNPNGSRIEFLLTSTGGRYLSTDDGIPGGDVLDFADADDSTFTVVGPLKGLENVEPGRDYVVVNNHGVDVEGFDAYNVNGTTRNIARITGYDKSTGVITLENNPFANGETTPSPDHRFQVVTGPVSYYCTDENGTRVLWRHWGYPISPAHAVPPAGVGQRAVIASNLNTCDDIFDFNVLAGHRTALVVLTLELRARNSTDPLIRLVHQVHVDNTP